MSPIKNYVVYTDGMKRAIYDKLFFVDKIEPTMIVDYGCADGTLMRELAEYYPEIPIIGVDNDPQMREKSSDLDIRRDICNIAPIKGSALVLSSVIHEIYSYCNPDEIDLFWKYTARYDYLVIRDMCVHGHTFHREVAKELIEKVREIHPSQMRDFEGYWGNIKTTASFMHFLLKYMYQDNWEREVQENYLPNTKEGLIDMISNQGRNIIYQEHYVLPYLKEKWKKDFDVNVDLPTHLKLIAKRV